MLKFSIYFSQFETGNINSLPIFWSFLALFFCSFIFLSGCGRSDFESKEDVEVTTPEESISPEIDYDSEVEAVDWTEVTHSKSRPQY